MAAPEERSLGRFIVLAIIAIGVVFGARRLFSGESARGDAAPDRAAPATVTPKRGALPPARPSASPEIAVAQATAAPLPASLRGTDEDGALRVDDRGDLIVAPDVLRFFDYYLSATGEESAAAIKARILAAIRGKLKGPAADQATGLLDRYLDYREATRSLPSAEGGDLSARLDALKRLRRDKFGAADADKLFGLEERTDAVAVDKQRVQADPSLSQEEKARRVAELDEKLPESVRATRERASRPLRQQEDEQAMRAAGASDEEIQRHRVATVGEEAADRLKQLDEQRADWKKRLQAFQTERETISRSHADPVARQAAVDKLVTDSFTPEERLRVKAADAIAAQAGQ